jgi:hypothetical protein
VGKPKIIHPFMWVKQQDNHPFENGKLTTCLWWFGREMVMTGGWFSRLVYPHCWGDV